MQAHGRHCGFCILIMVQILWLNIFYNIIFYTTYYYFFIFVFLFFNTIMFFISHYNNSFHLISIEENNYHKTVNNTLIAAFIFILSPYSISLAFTQIKWQYIKWENGHYHPWCSSSIIILHLCMFIANRRNCTIDIILLEKEFFGWSNAYKKKNKRKNERREKKNCNH